ncbi:MAG: hypothetical protein MRY32_00160 [Rickettsiales bacterium]|nr:hypothetical protein [Rickettsiales bacterium]
MIETVTPTASHYTRLATMFFWRYLGMIAFGMIVILLVEQFITLSMAPHYLQFYIMLAIPSVIETMHNKKVGNARFVAIVDDQIFNADDVKKMEKKDRSVLQTKIKKLHGRFLFPYLFWHVLYWACLFFLLVQFAKNGPVDSSSYDRLYAKKEMLFSIILFGWVVPYVIFVRLINNPKKGRMLALVKAS